MYANPPCNPASVYIYIPVSHKFTCISTCHCPSPPVYTNHRRIKEKPLKVSVFFSPCSELLCLGAGQRQGLNGFSAGRLRERCRLRGRGVEEDEGRCITWCWWHIESTGNKLPRNETRFYAFQDPNETFPSSRSINRKKRKKK